ncbi:MAG: TonB-dependent receptor [Candidatus Binatia bacterium]
MYRFILSLIGILFVLPELGLAQSSAEPTLPGVVVTATRTEISPEQLTTSLTVITAEDIKNRQAETVLELLREVPSVDVVQSGSRGNTTSVFIRGSESDHVLVLIDGIEANSTTTGAFNFAHLTTENVERIEILRGSGGTLYGSQAIGGVIQIITKAGKGKPEGTLSVEGGNGYTHRQVFSLNGGIEKLGYSFSLSRFETDGFRSVNDDYRNLATSSRLDFRPTDNTLLRGIFHFRKTEVGLFNSNNFFPVPVPDPNARDNVTDYLAKLEWQQKLTQAWEYRLAGSLFKEHEKFSDDPDPDPSNLCAGPNLFFCDFRTRNRFRPKIWTGEFQTNYRWQEWSTTTFGLEYKTRQARTDSFTKEQDSMASYLQEQLRFFGDRLVLVGGVRLDDNKVFGTEWSPSASGAYSIPETGTKFKVSYAEGFRAPMLNELFFPGFSNPNLGPETSWEINAGVEQKFMQRLLVGLTYFHREVKDLIEFTPPTFQPINIGKVILDGIEVFGDLDLSRGFTLRAGYTFLESETSTGVLARRPRHRGNVQLNYRQEAFHANLNANIVGRRDDFDVQTGANIKDPAYVRVDLASSYTLPWQTPGVKNVALFGKIENLFNKKYEEADGFRARPLNFLLGIRATFGSK